MRSWARETSRGLVSPPLARSTSHTPYTVSQDEFQASKTETGAQKRTNMEKRSTCAVKYSSRYTPPAATTGMSSRNKRSKEPGGIQKKPSRSSGDFPACILAIYSCASMYVLKSRRSGICTLPVPGARTGSLSFKGGGDSLQMVRQTAVTEAMSMARPSM